MEVFGVTLTTWTAKSLWLAMIFAVAAAIVYAGIFLTGYVVNAYKPHTRLARYFNETDLFALWMVSMICAMGLALLLYLHMVTRFTDQEPILGVGFTFVSILAVASPLFVLVILGSSHRHIRNKRGEAVPQSSNKKASLQPAKPKTQRTSAQRKTSTKKSKPAPKQAATKKPAVKTKQKLVKKT